MALAELGQKRRAMMLESVLPRNERSRYLLRNPDPMFPLRYVFISVLDPRSVKQLMASNNGEKYFSRACIKER